MVQYIKVTIPKVKSKAKDNTCGTMTPCSLVTGLTIRSMDMVHLSILMAPLTKANGKIARCTALEYTNGKTAEYMMASSRITECMAEANTS